jgi:hypothetical protein
MTFTAKAASSLNCDAALSRIIGAPRVAKFKTWTGRIGRCIAGLREFAPYAAIELLLPGGSLMALMLWFYRRRKRTKTEEGRCGVTVAPPGVLAHAPAVQGKISAFSEVTFSVKDDYAGNHVTANTVARLCPLDRRYQQLLCRSGVASSRDTRFVRSAAAARRDF